MCKSICKMFKRIKNCCFDVTRWCGGWTNSFENFNSDLRNVFKAAEKNWNTLGLLTAHCHTENQDLGMCASVLVRFGSSYVKHMSMTVYYNTDGAANIWLLRETKLYERLLFLSAVMLAHSFKHHRLPLLARSFICFCNCTSNDLQHCSVQVL